MDTQPAISATVNNDIIRALHIFMARGLYHCAVNFPTHLLLFALGAMLPVRILAAGHPLDPLSESEIRAAVDVLSQAGRVDATSRFAVLKLAEPVKRAILEWQPGDKIPRRAFAAVRHDRKLYETVIDLDSKQVVSWQAVEGAQPAQLADEWVLAQQIVRKDQAWLEAVRRRGVDDPKSLVCPPDLPGYFGSGEDAARRLGKVTCYDASGERNLWGRPLEGLVATVDYDQQRVIELYDAGPIPMGDGGAQIAANATEELPSLGPRKKGYRIDGHQVDWGMWRFRLHVDPRTGPVLSQVMLRDEAGDRRRLRAVLYRAEVAEMFVPYMDPGKAWYYRAYLDVGEYGIGASGTPLQTGRDCPKDATLLDATFADHLGRPRTKHGIVCIFERATGDVAWTHFEASRQRSRSDRYIELVVRFVVWLGNYDYVLDWIFTPTGSLKGRVGATGVVKVKAVAADSMDAPTAAADTAYGRLILPHTVAVNHDHFFAFRLDLDVDGPTNSLSIDRLRRVDLDPQATGTPLRSVWQVFPEIAATEPDAMLSIDPQRPALWRVINTASHNTVGSPTSFQLRPGAPGVRLPDADVLPHPRAAFTQHHLWVTPYSAEQRYPAGEYPNQHPGGGGLPEWTRHGRSIRNTDIVLWYTIGMHHVVRAEDWPIMPVLHHEFELRPFDFFPQNPAVQVRQ